MKPFTAAHTQTLGGRLRTHPEMIFSPRNDHIPQVTPMVEEHPGAFCIKVGSRHPNGQLCTSLGKPLFIGVAAGDFTMSPG